MPRDPSNCSWTKKDARNGISRWSRASDEDEYEDKESVLSSVDEKEFERHKHEHDVEAERNVEAEREHHKESKIDKMKRRIITERNKRIKTIYEDEEIDYNGYVSGSELEKREHMAKKFSDLRIKEVFHLLRLAQNVDLCFLVDSTGSMQSYIDEVRNSIYLLIDCLTKKPAGDISNQIAKQVRLGFVGYRDHDDDKQLEVFSFNESVDGFRSFCNSIDATGGGDSAEDVFGGLEAALNMDWSAQSGTKVVFHIADAPCHGREFHKYQESSFINILDRYLDGDPKGRSHEDLFKRFHKQQIQYYFGKINDSTDRMIEKFSYAYGEPITDFNLKDVSKICDSVVRAVTISVSRSKIKSASTTSSLKKKEKPFKIDPNEPDWSCIEPQKGMFMSYRFPERIEDIIKDIPLIVKSPKKAVVEIAENPFDQGNERIAYYGRDLSPYVEEEASPSGSIISTMTFKTMEEDIVLKEYKFEGIQWTAGRRFEAMNQLQTIAAYLAHSFMKELKASGAKPTKLKFLKIRTLAIDGEKTRYMSCEKRYKKEDKFIRFTNNTGYRMLEDEAKENGIDVEFVQMLMAFSHWTYQVTKKYLMVVDLQGVVTNDDKSGEKAVYLTDPAIHCENLTRFHPTNLGKEGMKKFFNFHACNKFCFLLELVPFET